MTLHWGTIAVTALIAAVADAALLAINDPGVFVGSASLWSVALRAAIGYGALLLGIIFMMKEGSGRQS